MTIKITEFDNNNISNIYEGKIGDDRNETKTNKKMNVLSEKVAVLYPKFEKSIKNNKIEYKRKFKWDKERLTVTFDNKYEVTAYVKKKMTLN